ncbi:AP1G1 protein, partial [Atractosteus spatula]|nr:AP1G1 protein [Atractosteus spatula]
MRAAVLERMPVMDRATLTQAEGEPAALQEELTEASKLVGAGQHPTNQVCDLLDLLGGSVSAEQTPVPVQTSGTVGGELLDLLGGLDTRPAVPSITAYEKEGLTLRFDFDRQTDAALSITITASNSTELDFTQYNLQAAVPKSVQLQMRAPSGDVIPAQGRGYVTQTVLLNNPNKVSLRMRIRLSYSVQGSVHQEIAQIDNFPPESWQ